MANKQAPNGQPGRYNSTPATRSDGDPSGMEFDVNGNQKTTLETALDESIDSITNYPAGCTITEVDLATDADVVVTASPAHLLGYAVSVVMSAHPALIKDSATTKITIAASTAAGTNIDTHSGTFATNITVESDDAATGTLIMFWRAA